MGRADNVDPVLIHVEQSRSRRGVTEFLRVFEDVGATFFDLETDLLVMLGEQGNIERVNNAFRQALGYTDADLIGLSLIRFVYMDDWAKFLNGFTAIQAQPFRLMRKASGEIMVRLIAWRHRNNKSYIIFRAERKL